jgi:hypothetical protein
LLETEHPIPSLLVSVFGSDPVTSVYACIMPATFDCFAKIIGACPLLGLPLRHLLHDEIKFTSLSQSCC